MKRVAPSSLRNCGPIGAQMKPLLPVSAHVLEIASGTGQHGAHMCELRPDIKWQYTDVDDEAISSQAAYVDDFPKQLMPPVKVDVTVDAWWQEFTSVNAIYCANMIHIAPWAAALGLARGAGQMLENIDLLCLYGPFLHESESAPSNLSFDENLKSRNPEWGVRNLASVKHIFADEGLGLSSTIEMPRDNYLLVFKPL